jgi:hypothetical protein
MCDYSLMEFPNRLAAEGEVLMVHRFYSGSMGLASPEDCCRAHSTPVKAKTFWGAVKEFFHPVVEAHRTTAVCIPPGARLILHDVPAQMQKQLAVGQEEEVSFVQLSAVANSYRDAVRFGNGQTIRLQELREGQRVEVMDMGFGVAEEPSAAGITQEIPVFTGRRE